MAIETDSIPTYLNELKSLRLNGMLRDMKKLTPDELIRIKKEIEKLLTFEETVNE